MLFDSIGLAIASMRVSFPGFTEEMYREMMCENIHETLKKLPVEKVVRTAEEEEERRRLYAQRKLEVPMFAGAKELLVALHHEGYTLALNTSAYERNVHPLLEKAEIATLFDCVATAEMSKSKHEKFGIIEERCGVTNDNTLFITDTVGDVREAVLAHIPTIAVTWGAHDRTHFSRLESPSIPIAIVDSFEELKRSIDRWAKGG